MKAGFGICFKENQHVDQGPAYAEMLRRNGEQPRKVTLDEYRQQHGRTSTSEYRDMIKSMQEKRLQNQSSPTDLPSYDEKNNSSVDYRTNRPSDRLPAGLLLNGAAGSGSLPLTKPIDGGIDARVYHLAQNYSQMKSDLQSTSKGHRDVITCVSNINSQRVGNSNRTPLGGQGPPGDDILSMMIGNMVSPKDMLEPEIVNGNYKTTTGGFMDKRNKKIFNAFNGDSKSRKSGQSQRLFGERRSTQTAYGSNRGSVREQLR